MFIVFERNSEYNFEKSVGWNDRVTPSVKYS